MLDAVKLIKDTEKEAILKIEEAKTESLKILQAAKEEAAKIVDEAINRAKSKSEQILIEWKASAEKEADIIFKEMDKELKDLETYAKDNIEEARILVTERVKGRR